MLHFDNLKDKLFIFCGPNVIESEKHCFQMAKKLKSSPSKIEI